MRKSIHALCLAWLLYAAMLCLPTQANAQCTNTQLGSNCSFSPFYRGEIFPSGGTSPIAVNPYSPGEYFRMPVLAGGCYSISTCGAPFDTQIGCFQNGNTSTPFAYNDDNGPLCSGTAASVTIVPIFTDYVEVDVRQYPCQVAGTSSITVTVQQNNNLAFLSSTAQMCQGQTRTLSAIPAAVSGALPNSGSAGAFSGTGVAGNTFTAPTPGASNQAYTITYTFGFVNTTQNITVFHAPTTANAGPDQTVCSATATLQGNLATFGTGNWSAGTSGTIVNTPTAASSSVSGLAPGTTSVFYWRISNGPCSPSIDSVSITRDTDPTTANAGPDQTVCSDSMFLAANTPSVGIGSWQVIAGTGILQSASSPNTMFSNLTVGTNSAVWTISNGVCPARRDTVVVLRDAQAPQPFAGPDKLICDNQTSLTGNLPSIGSGFWTVLSGSGVVLSPTTPNSILSSINVGTTVLTWSIGNGSCPVRSDTVIVTRNALPNAPAITGIQTVCYGASTTLSCTSNAASPTYTWWDASTGGNLIAAGTNFITPPLVGNITVYAEVNDGNTGCSSLRTAYAISVVPSPTVNLGSDTLFCASDSLCLNAGGGMSAYSWNTGLTSQILCTNVTGTYWVRITDQNGCQASDTINIVTTPSPNVNLGPDFSLCPGYQQTVGVALVNGQNYLWSTGATTNNIAITSGGNYSLTVSDVNGCSDNDAIVVTQLNLPVAAFSVDTSGCPNVVFTDQSTDATTWSWTFGNGFSSSGQNPNFTYSSNGNYLITLISTGACGSDTTQQNIALNCLVGLNVPQNLQITVYPNPNDGQFKIHFQGLLEECTLEIFNELGQKVYANAINGCAGDCEHQVNISQHASGVYFAKMRIGDISVSKRVIIR